MNNKNKKNKRNYSIYMNVRISKKENRKLTELMGLLNTCNKSKIVRYLINNNGIVKGGE